ncbi:hypothetical protein QBC39DRAFT_184873 [Podospora conica]|nr:hypothetical protein QBC39DRAFT_184873 [Schizothecium conicum]
MLGKIILTLDGVLLLVGAPLADYNHTHIFNPRWPPHAKFHGAQTITLSVTLGLATLFYTWGPSFKSTSRPAATPAIAATQHEVRRQRARDSLGTAAFVGSVYWLAGLAAILYPGTDGVDPEFGTPGSFPQGPLFATVSALAVLGAVWERWTA